MDLVVFINGDNCARFEGMQIHFSDIVHVSWMHKFGFLLVQVPHCHIVAWSCPKDLSLIVWPLELINSLVMDIFDLKKGFRCVADVPHFDKFLFTACAKEIPVERWKLTGISHTIFGFEVMNILLAVSGVPHDNFPSIIAGGKNGVMEVVEEGVPMCCGCPTFW